MPSAFLEDSRIVRHVSVLGEHFSPLLGEYLFCVDAYFCIGVWASTVVCYREYLIYFCKYSFFCVCGWAVLLVYMHGIVFA